jgi:hypothetical protein
MPLQEFEREWLARATLSEAPKVLLPAADAA